MARVPTPNIDVMLNEGLAKIANEVTDEFAPKPEKQFRRSQFAIIGHQAIDAMVQAAKDVVTKANEELAAIEARAEQMRVEFDERDKEIAAMMERVTRFGNDQLSAHSTFTGQKALEDK